MKQRFAIGLNARTQAAVQYEPYEWAVAPLVIRDSVGASVALTEEEAKELLVALSNYLPEDWRRP